MALNVLLRFKIKNRVLENKPSSKQVISQQNILEILFSNPNLSRNNQHKSKTLLP